MTQVLLNHFSFCLPAPRELLVLLAVRTRPEVHVDAEGDELDEEEHVGDGDARQEAVDGRAVHLLAGQHGDVEQVLGCYSVVSRDFTTTITASKDPNWLLLG